MLLSKFDKLPIYAMVPPIIDDFSLFYSSIIFIKRYCLMRNSREPFSSLISEYSSIPYDPTKSYGLTQKIKPNVCLSSN